jgi:hypothetical protein
MTRPYLNFSIQELENRYTVIHDNKSEIEVLLRELDIRTTSRAKKLSEQARRRVQELSYVKPFVKIKDVVLPIGLPVDFPPFIEVKQVNSDINAVRILDAWTALEVLSPQSFLKPEQLAQNGDRTLIKSAGIGLLPWDGDGEKSKPDYKLFYHIVLGTVKMPEAVAALMEKFPDSRAERPVKAGEAVLASLLVDRNGFLIDEGAAVISSFGWGVSNVLKGNLRQLGDWAVVEPKLTSDFYNFINRKDDEGNPLPVSSALIGQAYHWIKEKFDLPDGLLKQAPFTVKVYHYMRNAGPPDPLLLNSFFVADLTAAKQTFLSAKSTSNLTRYLGGLVSDRTYDLLVENDILEQIVAPENFPPARWPGKGRHSLVLLQQAAVNLSVNGLRGNGILPVNGPPGTGKTTLLRDIVAGVVTERAKQMVSFTDPKTAFTHSGEKINVGNGWLHLYQLNERLKGFEMLVVSSNNKAVENVSAELPSLDAIADDATDLRYFKTLSDAVHQKETWGMCAAVLGNALNRATFMQRFWWDKETGFRTYLAAASGISQNWEETDSKTGTVRIRTPHIVEVENAPASPELALVTWHQARQQFQSVLQAVEDRKAELAIVRAKVRSLPRLITEERDLATAASTATLNLEHAQADLHNVSSLLASTIIRKKRAENQITAHRQSRPSFIARLLNTTRFVEWKTVNQTLLKDLSDILEMQVRQLKSEQDVKYELAKRKDQSLKAIKANKDTLKVLSDAQAVIAQFQSKSETHLIDADFWRKPHAVKQLTSPWFDAADQRLRDALFIEAMNIHKAFIDASAQYFRHNLGVLMMALSGKDFSDKKKQVLLPDMWASLFLVIPCISTTFASVGRMMKELPPESLGYLLVDEAGQALPQAAIGALMRTKRAIIVGDPVQIEPVVSLPDSLTRSICGEFLVEADRYNAPEGSVQTLGDQTSAFVANFVAPEAVRTVGVPLLVHRRCADPMFSISNKIGYGGQMVQAKRPLSSSIRDLFGPSRWFDIAGQAQDKWCAQEGDWVIGMLQQLKSSGIKPDLYIVSPFVIVADNLRMLLRRTGILHNWVDNPESWPSERVGTVHTVQGREAEAVIFVLGAPLPAQSGARNWAGKKPNLLNVAVTRSKEVLYVVGNRSAWKSAHLFQELHRSLSDIL